MPKSVRTPLDLYVSSAVRTPPPQISHVYSVVSAYEQLFQDQTLAKHREVLQKCNLNDYITPNLTYDKERSDTSLNDLQNSIPLTSGLVQRGEKIIDRGDIVDGKTYNKLLSFQKEMERQNVDQEKIRLNIIPVAVHSHPDYLLYHLPYPVQKRLL